MLETPETIAIVGGTLIDGNGGPPLEDSVILIDGKRIVAIGDRSTPLPPQAKQIVATGKFIIPGLMDAYVYLVEGGTPNVLIRYEGRYDELAIEAAQVALKNGVTTVFDAWGPREDLIRARDAINQGRSIGSRIYLSGNWVGIDGPYSADMRPQHKDAVYASFAARIDHRWQANVGRKVTSMSPEQVRRVIREYVQSGIDYLSYAASDHMHGALRYIVFSPRVQQVMVEEAHRAGLPVCGFRPATGEALQLAVDAGVDVIQAPEFSVDQPLSEETVAFIAQRQVPCVIGPRPTGSMEWHREHSSNNKDLLHALEIAQHNHRSLARDGVPLLLGSGGWLWSSQSDCQDLLPPGTTLALGEGHANSMLAMQQIGMTPMAALSAVTRDVARAYKVDESLGTLQRGKLADLLVLERNPLENVENYRSISVLMKEGRVIDRKALPTQRLLTEGPKS